MVAPACSGEPAALPLRQHALLRVYPSSHSVVDSIEQTLLSLPLAAWFSFPPLLLLFHSLYCVFARKVPLGAVILYASYSFVMVVCWITVVCSALINLLELLQMLTNVNTVFLGLTVLAWANCIGGNPSPTQTTSPSLPSPGRATPPPPSPASSQGPSSPSSSASESPASRSPLAESTPSPSSPSRGMPTRRSRTPSWWG
jgi:hypothetical protein